MNNGDLFMYKGHTVYMYFRDACVAFYYVNKIGGETETNSVTDDTVKNRVAGGATFICNLGDVLHRIYQGELK